MYTDASVQDFELRIGYRIQKSNGEVIHEHGKNTMTAQDSTQGEIISILHALRYTITNTTITHLTIYTDSHSVKEMLSERSDAEPKQQDVYTLITATRQLLKNFTQVEVFYIESQSNPAHSIAYYTS